jgi:hypothetical protein
MAPTAYTRQGLRQVQAKLGQLLLDPAVWGGEPGSPAADQPLVLVVENAGNGVLAQPVLAEGLDLGPGEWASSRPCCMASGASGWSWRSVTAGDLRTVEYAAMSGQECRCVKGVRGG